MFKEMNSEFKRVTAALVEKLTLMIYRDSFKVHWIFIGFYNRRCGQYRKGKKEVANWEGWSGAYIIYPITVMFERL